MNYPVLRKAWNIDKLLSLKEDIYSWFLSLKLDVMYEVPCMLMSGQLLGGKDREHND